jgi:large subunit ribosomal protein L1
MASRKSNDMSANNDVVKVVANPDAQPEAVTNEEGEVVEQVESTEKKVVKKAARVRSRKYAAVRAQVDKTKIYDAFAAIELLKKLSYSKFPGTIVADIIVREAGDSVTLTFPHSTGKSVRVAVVNDEVLAQIEAGTIEFDVLITEPRFMPKLAKHARTLGPKGLMPNPKNGTITDNPDLKRKELEGGKVAIKAEKKAPLMHVMLGKTSMDTKELVENMNTLLTALKGKALKASVTASMSPSIKVAVL